MQWHLAMLTLVLVLVLFSWTMLAALEVKVISLTAHVAGQSAVTEATVRMLEWGVKVDFCVQLGAYEPVCAPSYNAKMFWFRSNVLVTVGSQIHEWLCGSIGTWVRLICSLISMKCRDISYQGCGFMLPSPLPPPDFWNVHICSEIASDTGLYRKPMVVEFFLEVECSQLTGPCLSELVTVILCDQSQEVRDKL